MPINLPNPLQEFLEYINDNRSVELEAQALRQAFSKLCQNFGISKEQINTNLTITDDLINFILVRTYQPLEIDENTAVIIYMHGGGHMVGSVNDYDTTVQALACRTDAIISSIDYRLAPEHSYPAALDDCLAIIQVLCKRFKNRRIFLAGDSAGGNLTALCSLQLYQEVDLAGQILIYPSLDFTCSCDSHRKFNQGFLLESKTIQFYFEHYLPDIFNIKDHAKLKAKARALSPLFIDIPPNFIKTLILSAELDPLCDEAELYYQKLCAQNIQAEYHEFPKMIHAFMSLYKLNPEMVERLFSHIKAFIKPTTL